MTLDAHVTAAAGALRLEVTVTAGDGEVLAVVGPNGAGKTTLLRVLAGLAPAAGQVHVDGRDVAALPPHRRRVGWVPQDVALFPHLDAVDNVAFGLGGRRARGAAREWLARVEAGDLADRRPAALSGGEAQRVALARALAPRPRLLLLDEPLAAVDATARRMLRRVLRTHLATYDGTTLLVTHDPVDAVTLADRVLVLEAGRVVQDCPPGRLVREPRSPWVARLFGGNAFRGSATGTGIALDEGGVLVTAEPPGPPGTAVLAVVPPEAVALHVEPVEGSPRNCWPVVVDELVPLGSRVRVHARGEPSVVAEVLATTVASLGLAEGRPLWATVKATEVTVVPL